MSQEILRDEIARKAWIGMSGDTKLGCWDDLAQGTRDICYGIADMLLDIPEIMEAAEQYARRGQREIAISNPISSNTGGID